MSGRRQKKGPARVRFQDEEDVDFKPGFINPDVRIDSVIFAASIFLHHSNDWIESIKL